MVLAALLEHRVRLRELWPGPPEAVALARAHDVLPLYADMGGVMALRADGTVVSIAWDATTAEPVTNPRLRDVALLQGARCYHELETVLPRRTEGAMACRHCNGTGRPMLEGRTLENVTCFCGGLGWIPEHWGDG